VPREVISNRGVAVVLAVRDQRQHAFVITKNYAVLDLGLADNVIPAATGDAAVIVETAVFDPGHVVASASPEVTPSPTDASKSKPLITQPALGDYIVRRYNAAGKPTGSAEALPVGMRVGTDTRVGLVVWQPVSRVFEDGSASESLSARAVLIRPDRSLREIGPVHPLAATATSLLVWNIVSQQFGVMPLQYVTASATTTVSLSASASASATSTRLATPTSSPTTVAGAKYYNPTRGFIVTGPASFAPDGSAFAAYAQVGNRRRLVVGELTPQFNDQIQVLALVKPDIKASPASGVPRVSSSPAESTSSASATGPAFEPDGYPIAAPLAPLWWTDLVVAVGADSTIVAYRPGGGQASLLDLGVSGATSLALAP
jgi:hypothetical protein